MNSRTESEALSKRCYRNLAFTCVASRCMGWQWDAGEMEVRHAYPEEQDGEIVAVPPPGDGWVRTDPNGKIRLPYSVPWHRPWGDHRPGFCGPCAAKISEVEVSQS